MNFISCDGTIPICEINLTKKIDTCLYCIGRRNQGFSKLKGKIKKYNLTSFTTIEDISNIRSIKTSFSSLDELKRFRYLNYKIGKCVFSSIADINRHYKPNIDNYKKEISKFIKSAARTLHCFRNYIKINEIDLVYIFNGRHSLEYPIIEVCKKESIDFITHEMAYNGGYCLFKNTQPQDYKFWIKEVERLWNDKKRTTEEKKKLGRIFFKEKLGLMQKRVMVSKSKKDISLNYYKLNSMDKVVYKEVLPDKWDKELHNIVIFQSSIFEEYTAQEFYNHKKVYVNQLKGIKKILQTVAKNKDIFVYLRLHPFFNWYNNTSQELEDYKKLVNEFDNLCLIYPNENICSYYLIRNANKILTFRSTVALEAAYMGKPSILLEDHLNSIFNCLYKPSSHKDLMTLLLDVKLPPILDDDFLKFGYFHLFHGIFPKYYTRNPSVSFEENWTLFKGKKVEPSLIIQYIIKTLEKHRFRFFYMFLNNLHNFILRKVFNI